MRSVDSRTPLCSMGSALIEERSLNPDREAVTDFTIASDSGTVYTSRGVVTGARDNGTRGFRYDRGPASQNREPTEAAFQVVYGRREYHRAVVGSNLSGRCRRLPLARFPRTVRSCHAKQSNGAASRGNGSVATGAFQLQLRRHGNVYRGVRAVLRAPQSHLHRRPLDPSSRPSRPSAGSLRR